MCRGDYTRKSREKHATGHEAGGERGIRWFDGSLGERFSTTVFWVDIPRTEFPLGNEDQLGVNILGADHVPQNEQLGDLPSIFQHRLFENTRSAG